MPGHNVPPSPPPPNHNKIISELLGPVSLWIVLTGEIHPVSASSALYDVKVINSYILAARRPRLDKELPTNPIEFVEAPSPHGPRKQAPEYTYNLQFVLLLWSHQEEFCDYSSLVERRLQTWRRGINKNQGEKEESFLLNVIKMTE